MHHIRQYDGLKEAYVGDYIGEYCRASQGGY